MRKSEVLHLKWEHVDLRRSCLHLPDSKTGPRTVPLAAPALELLSKATRIEGNTYVCFGRKPTGHYVDIFRIWKRLRIEAGLEDRRVHDLRHTFTSFGAAAGYGLFVIGKVLGHARSATTERHTHLGQNQVHAATEDIGRQVAAAMSGPLRKEEGDGEEDEAPYEQRAS